MTKSKEPLTLQSLRDMITAKLNELNDIILKQDEAIKKVAGMIEGLEMVAATINAEMNYDGQVQPATGVGHTAGSCSGTCSEGDGTCACSSDTPESC